VTGPVGERREDLPAWSLPAGAEERLAPTWPAGITRDWAFGGASGKGVRVAVIDSGVAADHPRVGSVARAVAVHAGDDAISVEEDGGGDLSGHGTACAGIIRSIAPDVELTSVRVLGPESTGSGDVLLAGLRWAVEEGYDVVNMSLSTRKREWALELHELADRAYFRRSVLVCSAHNLAIESFPWRFAAVVSVGSHEEEDPLALYYNPKPPVEFFARGIDVDVAWGDGTTIRASGNSFATPHVAGLCALALSKHPGLTPFQVKSLLYLTAANVEEARGE
jgi:subtilisin family serine protease